MALNEKYWSDRYLNNDAAWDIGYPSPALTTYIDQLKDKTIAILIPGGGNSYEAGYLLEKGFTNITVVDISAIICDAVKQRYQQYLDKELKVVHSNFFDLEGQYDLILEQTFLSALEPELRPAYVAGMQRLLKPGGKLAGVLFSKAFESNPPFGGSVEEYIAIFTKDFEIAILEPCYNSIEPRAGAEVFIKLVKK